jgi:hypothetical protein
MNFEKNNKRSKNRQLPRKFRCSIRESIEDEQGNVQRVRCKDIVSFNIKMLVQHPTCARWQTWKVCHEHKDKIERDKLLQEAGLEPDIGWCVTYYTPKNKPKKVRPVVVIGDIIRADLKVEMI